MDDPTLLSWIEKGQNIAALLVAIGVAAEFVLGFIAGPARRRVEGANQAEIVRLTNTSAGFEQEAAKLRKDAEGLKADNLKLSAAIQPRTISESDRHKIADELRQFAPSLKGRKVTIASQIGDGETMLVALEMADILRRSGIEFDPSGMGRTSWIGTVFMGVRIVGPPSDSAFVAAFTHELFAPLDKGIFGEVKPEYKELRIEVGVKPITGLPKEWLRQTTP